VQIGVELARVARVTLTSRQSLRFLPQRPFGQDVHFWMWLLGVDRLPLSGVWQRLKSNPVLDTGRYRAAITAGHPDWRPLFEHLTVEGVVWTNGREEPVDSLILDSGVEICTDKLNQAKNNGKRRKKQTKRAKDASEGPASCRQILCVSSSSLSVQISTPESFWRLATIFSPTILQHWVHGTHRNRCSNG